VIDRDKETEWPGLSCGRLNQELPHATPHSPIPAVCQRTLLQSGSHTETGDTTFFNFDTFTGSRQSTGKTDFYKISDGASTTRNSVGNAAFYSDSTSSLSGSPNSEW